MKTLNKSTFKVIHAIFLLLTLGFTWGSGYALARFAMTHDVPALGYAFWQALGPALLLSTSTIIKEGVEWLHVKHWPFFLVCGLIGIVIPNTNMYFVAQYLPAGLLAVLVNTVPLIVYPLALTFKQERFDGWRLIALIAGLYGILLIIAPAGIHGFSPWALVALISPLSFAVSSLYIASHQSKELQPLPAASGMLIAASLILLPVVIEQQAFFSLLPPLTINKTVILAEIFLSSLGYLLFFKLVRLAGAVFYSLTGAVVALTGLFWGRALFAETTGSQQACASLLIILAILLLSWRQKQHDGNDHAQSTGTKLCGTD